MKSKVIITIVIITIVAPLNAINGVSFSKQGFYENLYPKVVHLFNGKNLVGWYTYLDGFGKNNDPNNQVSVENGMIHITGKAHGSIITKKTYQNYKLVVEYKWGDQLYGSKIGKARDSGILLNSIGKDGAWNGMYMHSIEVNIIEGGPETLLSSGTEPTSFL